jgi:phage-related protein
MATRKLIAWLAGEVKTPPFSSAARIEAGELLRTLQNGNSIVMPLSRPMPDIGQRVGELRVRDENHNWRIIYRTDPDVIIVVEVFDKKTQTTPRSVINRCKTRLRLYDET